MHFQASEKVQKDQLRLNERAVPQESRIGHFEKKAKFAGKTLGKPKPEPQFHPRNQQRAKKLEIKGKSPKIKGNGGSS